MRKLNLLIFVPMGKLNSINFIGVYKVMINYYISKYNYSGVVLLK